MKSNPRREVNLGQHRKKTMLEHLKKTKARLLAGKKKRKPFSVPCKITPIKYNGQKVNIHSTFVKGFKTPIVFLTGLGCSQSDFRKALESKQLKGHTILLFDFPGQGTNPRLPPSIPQRFKFTMEELAELTKAMLDHYGLKKVALVGHSMGGIVGRKLAQKHPERIDFFVDVESPLDLSECQRCIKIANARGQEYPKTMTEIAKNYATANKKAEARHSNTFKGASPQSIRKYSESIIREIGKRHPLNELPKGNFAYFAGENNNSPQLKKLKEEGIQVIRIPNSGHFIMEDNPQSFYGKLAQLIG
ncbi:MAG: alpha/beta hydrolase [archaeon]